MANANDKVILLLQQKVEEKKDKIAKMKAEKYKPITPCILNWEGVKHNFNVLHRGELTLLLVKLNALVMSADDLLLEDFAEKTIVDGFTISDWIEDLKGKIKDKDVSIEEGQLTKIEKQLNTMLSEDKKVELQLAEIAKLLD